MRSSYSQSSVSDDPDSPALKIFQPLLHRPWDVIDVRSLMHRFRASADDVQWALKWLELNILPAAQL